MQIAILVEPIEGGRFRARAGEPFALAEEGITEADATARLAAALESRMRSGARLAIIEVQNGTPACEDRPLHFESLPDDDWFFKTMREAIDTNRQREETGA